MGAEEIWITPSNGISNSRIRNIAPATDSADNMSAITTVAFGGANKPTLMKMIASQAMRTISIGGDIELSVCSNSNQRICPTSVVTCTAWDLRDRCASFCGESCWIELKNSSPEL